MSDRWHAHFIQKALTCSDMSKDPNTRVGAVIIGPDRETRSDGFNGLPRGLKDTPERLADRDVKNELTVHAEVNAVTNAARIGVSTRGCTLYLAATDHTGEVWGGPPCVNCSLVLMQAGIARIVAPPFKPGPSKWRDSIERARGLLLEASIEYEEYTGTIP